MAGDSALMEVASRCWGPERRGQTQLWEPRAIVPKVVIFCMNSQLDLPSATPQRPPLSPKHPLLKWNRTSLQKQCLPWSDHVPLSSRAWKFRSELSREWVYPRVQNDMLAMSEPLLISMFLSIYDRKAWVLFTWNVDSHMALPDVFVNHCHKRWRGTAWITGSHQLPVMHCWPPEPSIYWLCYLDSTDLSKRKHRVWRFSCCELKWTRKGRLSPS